MCEEDLAAGHVRWFEGGKLNVAWNCLDRHLATRGGQAAGQAFYNTSKFTLRDLRARASQQQLKADFEAQNPDIKIEIEQRPGGGEDEAQQLAERATLGIARETEELVRVLAHDEPGLA